MTRHEALTALLAKVEDGTLKKGRSAQFKALGFSQMSRALAAYSGSLDAAHALHEALLPTGAWSWQLWIDHNGIPTAVIDGWEFSTPKVTAETPARAWLIAILKALIAMEEG